MAEKLTLPDPTIPLTKCPHCGAEMKITEHWYVQLLRILNRLNAIP